MLWLLFTVPRRMRIFTTWWTSWNKVSPEFKAWWRTQDVHTRCSGVRKLVIDGQSEPFEYTSLTGTGTRGEWSAVPSSAPFHRA